MRGSGGCEFIIQSPKTKQNIRTIPVPGDVAKSLEICRKGQGKDTIVLRNIWQENGNRDLRNLVFAMDTESPIDRSNTDRTIRGTVSDIDLERAE